MGRKDAFDQLTDWPGLSVRDDKCLPRLAGGDVECGDQCTDGVVDIRLSASLYRQLMRWGPERLSRDITLVHQRVVAQGLAGWLEGDGPVVTRSGQRPLEGDMERAVRRVRQLLPDNA